MAPSIQAAFDAVAQDYDAQRRQLIPCFDDFYGTCADLVAELAPVAPRILDLGAGTGLLSALIAQARPSAQFVLTDLSEGMLARARERFLGTATDVSFRVMDHLALDGVAEFDVVMSALSIHHLTDAGKQALYGAAARALKPGGLFLNADQVSGDDAEMERRYWTHWHQRVTASGLGKAEIDAAIERQGFDVRSPLAPQLAWLARAGLSQVECRYKSASFVVMTGLKRSNPPCSS
jgi:tRNA (cmo5U34)-methyltransferase